MASRTSCRVGRITRQGKRISCCESLASLPFFFQLYANHNGVRLVRPHLHYSILRAHSILAKPRPLSFYPSGEWGYIARVLLYQPNLVSA